MSEQGEFIVFSEESNINRNDFFLENFIFYRIIIFFTLSDLF